MQERYNKSQKIYFFLLRTVSGENLCFIILRSKKSRTYSRIIDKGFSIQFSKLFEHSGSVSLVFNGSGSVKILSIRRNPDPCVTGSLLTRTEKIQDV